MWTRPVLHSRIEAAILGWGCHDWRRLRRGLCRLHREAAHFPGAWISSTDYQAAPIEAISLRARQESIRVDHVLHDDQVHHGEMQWVASQSEVCIVFGSLFLKENEDRSHLRLDHDGEEMIKVVEKNCGGEVVVVLHVGGQVVMEDWVSFFTVMAFASRD